MKHARRAAVIVLGLVGLVLSGLCVPGPLTWGASGPPLALDPVPVQQGGRLHLTGRGFLPGEPVAILASEKDPGSSPLEIGRGQATLWGTLDVMDLALPEGLVSGAHTVEAVGQISGRRSAATLYIRANEPWIVLENAETRPYEHLGLVAGGFLPGERVLVFLESRREEAETEGGGQASITGPPEQAAPSEPVDLVALPTDRAGNTRWTEVEMPLISYGPYALVARGESSGLESRRDVRLKPFSPVIELSPWAGPPGTKIESNARGFAPGEMVRVYLGEDSREVATLAADQYGDFWGAGPIQVPYGTEPGPLTVTFVGEESGALVSLQFKVLEPRPWLELTVWWGPPGVPVGFSGGGWAAGERISFHIGSELAPPVAFAQADDFGWLRYGGPVYIPGDAEASVTFVAVGEQSHAKASATFKVVYPFGLRPQGQP